MTLRIKAGQPVYGGYTLYRDEGKGIIFVKGALPEEVVEIVIEERKKDYSIARVVEIIEPSVWRVKALCEFYGICGGCQLQHVDYNFQLTLKAEILKDLIKRIAKIEIDTVPVRSLRQFNYRYRAQFKVGSSGIGFYKEGTRELVAIKLCPLMIHEINDLLPQLSNLKSTTLREIHIASNGKESLIYLKGVNFNNELLEYFSLNGLSGVAFENKNYGKEFIYMPAETLYYTVSAKSFFQTNWELNKELINKISEMIDDERIRLLDLYAGAGNFSLPLASKVKDVIAVEENPYVFNDLKRNIEVNGIKNLRPINSSIERFRPSGHYDIVIIDPPRPGMSDRALKNLLEASPDKIFYISCNPSTLARDIKKLSGNYELQFVEIFDFFPNTYHIETLAVLHKRG